MSESDDDRRMDTLLAQWRESFDRSFAVPAALPASDLQDVLGIRIAGQPHALLLHELVGLQPWRAPTPYPVASESLLGLIAHQGAALPLFDLQALLGKGRIARPAWVAVLREAPLALAFEGFDGQWRLGPEDRIAGGIEAAPDGAGAPRPFVSGAVRCGGQLRPVIVTAALAAALQPA